MAALSDPARAVIEASRAAAMITTRKNGTAHAVRVGVALVEGKLWSSGTADTEKTEEEFLRVMADEGRLFYEFDVVREYGLFT